MFIIIILGQINNLTIKMKKVAIIANDYKLAQFRKELEAQGFTNFEIAPYQPGTSTIGLMVKESDLIEISKVCQSVELFCKRQN